MSAKGAALNRSERPFIKSVPCSEQVSGVQVARAKGGDEDVCVGRRWGPPVLELVDEVATTTEDKGSGIVRERRNLFDGPSRGGAGSTGGGKAAWSDGGTRW